MDTLVQYLTDFVNFLINSIVNVLTWLIDYFPNSPFSHHDAPPASLVLNFVAWFIPFDYFVTDLILYAGAILMYYGVSWLASILKMVKS